MYSMWNWVNYEHLILWLDLISNNLFIMHELKIILLLEDEDEDEDDQCDDEDHPWPDCPNPDQLEPDWNGPLPEEKNEFVFIIGEEFDFRNNLL